MLRTFVAVDLPLEVRRYLGRTAAELARPLPPGAIRWVDPGAMHLTLRFIGDTSPAQVPPLAEQLARAAGMATACTVQLGQVGYFPHRQRPRVVWVGLQGELAPLTALQAAVEQAVVALGWPRDDRPFQPHLTLGRVKEPSRLPAGLLPERLTLAPNPFRVTACHLIRSELRPQGPLYTTLHTFPLAG